MTSPDSPTLEELRNRKITTLADAIEYLEFTPAEDGTFFYDAGHAIPFEANEFYVRRQLQGVEHALPEIPVGEDDDLTRTYHEYRLYSEAYRVILADILARPGYVALADLPETPHQKYWRALNIETLEEALSELESIQISEGVFAFNGDSDPFPLTEEYCQRRIDDLKANPIPNDDHINFYPYHNHRFWLQSFEIVLAEIRRSKNAS